MKFPLVCIDLNIAKETQVITLLQGQKLRMFKGTAEFYNREMVGLEFCDINGNVFILSRVDSSIKWSIIQFFRFTFSFPEIGVFRFKTTNKFYTLEEFKRRCKELIMIESIEEIWEEQYKEIERAENYHDAMGQFGLGWQNDVVK